MDLKKIQSLIANGETENIEYKNSIAELDKLGKALCGQLNDKGGYGFIGITDAGKIVGTEVVESTKNKLTAFKNFFDPWPHIDIEYVPLNNSDKQVITLTCKPSNTGPHTFKGKPYLKTPSGIKPMPAERYKHLLLDHAGLSKLWESLPANVFSIDDLDHEEIIRTFKIGLREERIPEDEYTENVTEILTHFDLLDGNVIKNAAMALFAKKIPLDYYSQCFIRMGRFIDDTMNEVIDSKQISGNAFQLLNQALEFVRRHLPISSRYDPNQFERIDEIALPLLAVREAIINALCHRDYSVRAGDISLSIFNDALEIHNIGHLYGDLTVEQLSVKHPSRRRNERIAQVFYVRKLIDRFGSGTRRILQLCAEQNLPAPQFSEETDGFQVRFPFREPIGPQKPAVVAKHELTPRQTEIINILKEHRALSTKDLCEKLNNPPTERWLRDELKHLMNLGLVRAAGDTNKRKWSLIY